MYPYRKISRETNQIFITKNHLLNFFHFMLFIKSFKSESTSPKNKIHASIEKNNIR